MCDKSQHKIKKTLKDFTFIFLNLQTDKQNSHFYSLTFTSQNN